MAWGRYAGYFFYAYSGSGKKVAMFGPFATRDEAASWAKNISQKAGKIFQKERPVRYG